MTTQGDIMNLEPSMKKTVTRSASCKCYSQIY